VISIISGDNVALLTGRILAAFGRRRDIPEDIRIRAVLACIVALPGAPIARGGTDRDPKPRYDAANRM